MDVVEVGGLRIAYERVGAGPAVVLLHGYVADGRTTWRWQLDGLSDEFTVVAWDAPGTGDRPIHQKGSVQPAMPTAWRNSSTHSGSITPASWACRSAASSRWRCMTGIPPSRRRWFWRPPTPAGPVPCPPDVAEARLQQALVLADLSPTEFVDTLLPTMFAPATAPDTVAAFRASMLEFHPVGFRAMARAAAENLRHVLPRVAVPTLLVYGEKDVRAGLSVARDLEAAISGARLVVLPGAGHLCNMEAPDEFNDAVRRFLHDTVT